MNITIKPALYAIILVFFIVTTGCQEQQSPKTDKRARLVANQNLQLKKQLHEKDREIQRQKDLVIECKDAMQAQQQQHERGAEGMLRIMQSLVEKEKQVQQLEAQIEELQSK
ncbi:MAG: hypothetical protein KAJ07_11955 [Planctomycetes bacterium]|nr:hypothetical protein [Planctomycetota bacterium]